MANKPSMSRVERLHREKVTRYSIRKYSFGAASVAVAALFMFLGNGAVSVQADQIQPGDTTVARPTTPTLDKSELTNLISEIETKLSNGSYDNKTEESVALLKADLEAAKTTLANATTQAELKKAYSKLVTTANTKLRNKAVEKKETPAVDTTEGKENVGKQAENTEPKSESNSIENTGSNDARNGKELDKNNAFRTETDTEKPKVSIDYDDPASKTFWITPTEETNITGRIKITDNSGKIVKGWMQKMGGGTDINVGYGLNNSNINGETTATAAQPATLSVTGTLQRRHPNGNPWSNGSTIVSRKVRAKDASNNEIDNEGASDPDYQVFFKVRSQNVKYTEDLANKAANFDKVAVANPAQLQQAELDKIKAGLQAGDVNNLNGKIDTVTQKGDKVVITYNDGTTAERPVTDFARINVAPTAEFPFSNAASKEIYVYGAEENSFDIKIKDDSGKIASATLRQGGNRTFAEVPGETNKISTQYGYKANTITAETPATEASPAVITYLGTPAPEGTFTQDKLDAATRGENPPGVVLGWRFLRVTDADGGEITGRATGADDPGSFVVVLKPQTQKYDIQEVAQADKVAVANPAAVTDAEFAKVKEKLKIEFSKTNNDANLAKEQGKIVEDKEAKIKTIEKVGNDLVLTYKDGSVDKKSLAELTRINQAPTVEFPFSNAASKEIYVYGAEENSFDIKIKDDSGKIASATLRQGGNRTFAEVPGETNKISTQYGYKANTITAETPATEASPAVITYSGTPAPEGTFTQDKLEAVTRGENPPGVVLGWRFLRVTDADGGEITGRATGADDPGSFVVVLKPQTQKYDVTTPENEAAKVSVVDANNVTDAEFKKIVGKNNANIKLHYSKKNADANLVAKQGQNVDDREAKIKSVTKVENNMVVTYKDGSTDTLPLTDFARTNAAPTVEIPYSNADKRQIYVYTGENTDLTFTGKDDTTVKNLYLRNKGLDESDNASAYGFTIGKVTDSAVASGEGTVSADKRTATIKMTGVTNLKAPNKWTSFIEAKDNDGVKSMPANESYSVENYELRRRKPGYVEFIVKSQADKYDIKAPTEKVAVTDPANVTEAELDKIKEKLQIEYSNNNDDANLADKKGKTVDAADAKAKIKSVTKDADGNLVVTYTDDSTDKKPLSEFVTLDKQPAIDAVNNAADEQIKAINDNAAATREEKDVAIAKVNADKEKALTAINDANVTTKDALDKAKESGTTAIAADNPVVAAKPEAKKAIDEAVKTKEAAIDARTDLTDDEKKAAKDAVKAAADKAKEAVDATTTDAEVTKAKEAGTTAVANITPVAKSEAKKAIAKALEDKNSEIDKRTDLTDEEKTAAKNEAKDKADAQLAKINEQPDAAATPAAAKTAQDVVDAAKKTGVDEVTAVNPVAAKKPEAKEAVDAALKAKVDAINAREDLTPAEKDEAKKAAEKAADDAKKAIDAATTDAAVDAAKNAGTEEVAKVNPVAKEKAKEEIAKELAKKEEAIDERKDLTDEEKAAAKEEAQAKAKEATDAINDQPANAETPEKAAEAQKAVDGAKDKGVADVKAVNPEAVTKPAAKKAIEDKLAKQLEDIANTPDATDEEKKVAADAAKALAEKAKEEIDKAGTDAEVKQLQEKAEGEIEKSVPVVEDKPNARKAIDEEATAKKAEIDARTDLTPKAKEVLKAKVDKVAEKSKEAIDAVSSVDDVNTIEEADKTAIKAIGEVNRPIDKVLVKDPSALTDEEKAKILEEVKKVNPTAKEVKYDDNGKIEVTTEAGDKGTINPTKLVKTEDQLDNGKGGNDINKPLDKVIVKDPSKLTDEEKAKIVAKVEEVNPDAIVTIDENGTVSVSTPDGKTSAIPASELVRTKEDTAKLDAGNSKIVKPADKVAGEANDPDDQAKAEEKLRELNPETKSVKFDEDGNATVTLKDGTTATILSEDLFKSEVAATKPNAGNDIVKPADKTAVTNPDALTPEEKKAIEDKVKAVNPGATVVVDDKGNATVTTPEGKTAVIPATDLTKDPEAVTKPNAGNDIIKPADKTAVKDPANLTPEEKKAIEDKVKAVNPDATVVVDDKGNATVTTPEGKTAVIPATDLTKSPEDSAKPNAGNDIVKPADKVVVDPAQGVDETAKKAIADKVKAVNPGAEVVVDDKGNATVTTPEGKTAVIPAADLTKSPEAAAKPNAGNDIVKPADKVVVDPTQPLSDDAKKAIADKVKAVNPGATVVVDDKGNATVTTPEGKTAVIPATDLTKDPEAATKPNAGNDIVKPADKTAVTNPDALTPEEKKAIEDKVKAVNPGATVVVDDKGNATVTTPEGKTAVIPAADLTKDPEAATKPNAGNDIVKPADKTAVTNPDSLTPEEKKAIADKVKAVNPGATVVVDDKGNTTVTTPEGKTAVIPATDLTKDSEAATKPNAGNDIVKPADKTAVKDPANLTPEEKKAIEDKVKAVNPDAEVVVDDKGNATVTTPEGKTAVIPATDLTKSPEAAAKPNAGNDIVKPADKVVVDSTQPLTDDAKKAIADKVKAVNPGATVVVDDKGNATVTLENGKTAIIPAADLTKSSDAEKAPKAGNDIVKPASKTKVANPDSLTPEEKKAIEDKVKAVNPDSTVVVDDKGNATVTTPEGKTAVIPASDLTKSEKDVNDGKAKDNAVTPASKTKVANPNSLTPEEKKAIADKVKATNPGAKVVVDDKGNATVVKDGNVSVIPSSDLVKVQDDANKPNGGNDANTPAAKTVVENLAKINDAEKKAIEDKVKAVNPGSTVVVDDKGNTTVTKGDGTVLNIPASDLVIPAEKFADEAKTAKVKTPAIRTLVGDKENLTKDEKDAVKKLIEAVNQGATVVVDDKGNATVTMPDGSTATISKEQLVKDKEAVSKSKHGGDNLDIDLSKVEVADLANITPEEKAKFQFKVLGAITNVEEFDLDAYIKSTDKDGNTVYTSKDSKVKITIDKDGNATVEKDGKKELSINIDKAGNVTIVTKEGQVLAIPRDDAFKQRLYVPSNGGGNNSGNGNGATNTDAKVNKAKLEGAIHQLDELIIKESAKLDAETAKEANDLLADAKKVFANADATQAEVDAMVKRIEDFMSKVAPATNHATPANDQAAQTSAVATATTQAAANASQEAAANARKAAKELPNTGTADSTVAMVAAAASALLGLGLAGRRRKEDEEA